MRVFLIGSKQLSVDLLNALLETGHDVLGVFSRDAELGMQVWHLELGHASLAREAAVKGIPVYEGMKVNSNESLNLLESLNLDLIVSCFWSDMFREPILQVAKYGAYNFHTAALPKHRGSRPIPWAIIEGDSSIGITCHQMLTGVDNGPIVDQELVQLSDGDTSKSAYDKLMTAGRTLALRTFTSFKSEKIKLEPQIESEATYHLRGEPFGGQVNYFWNEDQKQRFIRAMDFPPFKGHRHSPQFNKEAALNISIFSTAVNPSNDSMFSHINEVVIHDYQHYQTRLSGGDVVQRKALRQLFSVYKGASLLINDVDLIEHYPILESLHQCQIQAVLSKKVSQHDEDTLIAAQPHFHANGVFEIPRYEVIGLNEVESLVRAAMNLVNRLNCPIYLIIKIKDDSAESVINKIQHMSFTCKHRFLKIEDIYNEFNTQYE